MSTHTGNQGLVKVGSNTVAELNGWSLDIAGDVIEDTQLTDTAKTFKPDKTSWTASLECHWDETDSTGQEALSINSVVTLHLLADGSGTGAIDYNGSAIVTSVGIAVAKGATVTRNISVQGSGALTRTVLS